MICKGLKKIYAEPDINYVSLISSGDLFRLTELWGNL